MPFFIDQTNRKVEIPFSPRRIISLVPSQTELLFDLGLGNRVIGITKFCLHPQEWFQYKQRVGGTKQLNIEIINSLKPDLIIANKEENTKEEIEYLAAKYPVWISDINNLSEAYEMIRQLGILTATEERATEIIKKIQMEFAMLTPIIAPLSCCYLIWQNPYMTVGGDTFIHAMIEAAGFANVFQNTSRYPAVTLEQIKATNCDLLFLSSEPFPFTQKHADELQSLLPKTKIILTDGEMFSWYGSRLLKAPTYFQEFRQQLK
jgi:ABC-type Fe3+-hydroxamate transport system substrate-binding protein